MKQKEIKDSKAKKQPLEDEQTKKVTGGIGVKGNTDGYWDALP